MNDCQVNNISVQKQLGGWGLGEERRNSLNVGWSAKALLVL